MGDVIPFPSRSRELLKQAAQAAKEVTRDLQDRTPTPHDDTAEGEGGDSR